MRIRQDSESTGGRLVSDLGRNDGFTEAESRYASRFDKGDLRV